MNFRLLLCIVMGVFVAHIGVFMLISQLRPKPKIVAPPPPNFSAQERVVVDAETGEKTVYREITVSTQFDLEPGPRPPETKPTDAPLDE